MSVTGHDPGAPFSQGAMPSGEKPGCQAKIPLAVFPRTWMLCGEPAAGRFLYRCACGHERAGWTCAAHQPAPGDVGCARCYDGGHECPMEATPG